jgi:transcriptional regulator with XRE-family HTH domain
MGRSNRPRPARLAPKLLKIRNNLGLTQAQLIERLGYDKSPLHPQNISGFETGEREPPLMLLLAYARLVGISTDLLIDDDLDLPKKLSHSQKQKRH